ncbi:MAG: putative hydro-lyase [Chloroflexi bacterium]|nr:putative hydro-lyase [Chloroflexota bacterium]
MATVTSLPDTPKEMRALIRDGQFRKPTSGVANGYAQANLAVLPRDLAFDFLLFCQRNSKPCPILEVIEPGKTEPKLVAPGADIRYDIPKYRIYRDGVLDDEVDDLGEHWRDDLVSFLLGCSFSFENAMMNSGIELRHIQQDTNVSMYITNIPTTPAGVFSGPMVVSMRPIPHEKVVKAVQVTSRYPSVHGAPVHIGDPAGVGIRDIGKPDFGDPTEIKAGEVPVFWACGVTPQAVAMKSKPSLMITHSPGYMFITDKRDEDYAVI